MPDFLDSSGTLGEIGLAREIDPASLARVLDRLLEALRADQSPYARILVSGQMAGLAFIDQSGKAVAPLISWQDTRYASLEEVRNSISAQELQDLGEGIRIGLPLVTLSRHKRPTGCKVTSLLAFVASSLAGTQAQAIHVTDAASWGMYNLRTQYWSESACRAAGVEVGQLPSVSAQICPIADGSLVNVAIGDQQASLLGANLRRGWLSVNLATGCQVSLLDALSPSGGQVRPYFDGSFLNTVTHLAGGRLLTQALRNSRGSSTIQDWMWLDDKGLDVKGLSESIEEVVAGIERGAGILGGKGLPIIFSGGLIQNMPRLQKRILARLGSEVFEVVSDNDSALAGLAKLDLHLENSRRS